MNAKDAKNAKKEKEKRQRERLLPASPAADRSSPCSLALGSLRLKNLRKPKARNQIFQYQEREITEREEE
jgi:hypothetical protein